MTPPALIPELAVRDCAASLAFYTGILGFAVTYQRPEEGFAFLTLGGAALMLDEIGRTRTFDAGEGPLVPPLGRGMNLQITVPEVAPILGALDRAGRPLYLPPEDKWYRRGAVETGNRQFVVADPDGYLLRFCEDLGTRPPQGAEGRESDAEC